MRARDIMTTHPAVVTPTTPLHEAATLMRTMDVGFLPVVDDPWSMRLRGVVTDRDLVVRALATRLATDATIADCMTGRPLSVVRGDADVHTVLSLMETNRVRRLPVVDGDDRLVGVIAQADVARHLGPIEPIEVERLVERLSQPAHLPA